MGGRSTDNKKKGKRSYLSDLRSPLVFFGLSLLVAESAFGGCLLKYSYSEKVVVVLSSWMGGLFLSSICAVSFLTYKVPKNMVAEIEYYAKTDQIRKDVESAQEDLLRVRKAVQLVMEFSANGTTKDAPGLLNMLTEVEKILLLTEAKAEGQVK